MPFIATIPGRFEVELHHPDAVLAVVEVTVVDPCSSSRTGSGRSRTSRSRRGSSTGARPSCWSSRSSCSASSGASRCSRARDGRPRAGRALAPSCLGPLRIVVQALSRGALRASSGPAALLGDTDPFRNLAPTWIYVVFWLGLPLLSVLFGNVWRALSPWRAIADGFVWVRERGWAEARPLAEYPERLGRWPAAVALFAFVSLELAYSDPSSPARSRSRSRSTPMSRCSAWPRSAARRGSDTARASPSCSASSRGWRRSTWSTGGPLPLAVHRPGRRRARAGDGRLRRGDARLGRCFDGFSRTTTWQNLMADVEDAVHRRPPELGELLVDAREPRRAAHRRAARGARLPARLRAHALVGQRAAIARPRLRAARSCRSRSSTSSRTTSRCSSSQGQYAVPLLSDPLGRGWNLFGTARLVPDLPFSRRTRPGTSRSVRSSPATSPGSRSPTTGP